ncbi:MAG: hypothetical protein HC897_18880 [Thermoanaerobaculia bacterium]|nr:hypothetical protein [Thermoanaerobaculia bacterium]
MKHHRLWILAGLSLLLFLWLTVEPLAGIERPGVTYTGAVLDAQKNVLDPSAALKIDLPAGKHELKLTGGEMFYGKGSEPSHTIAIRSYDRAMDTTRLYRLGMSQGQPAMLPIELGDRGGFIEAFIVDEWARDNRGSMTLSVDGKTHLIDPRTNVLDLRKAVKLSAPMGTAMGITQLELEDLRYGAGQPLAEECLARVRYLKSGRVEYVVLSPEHMDYPFEGAELALFLVDETPKDNTGHVRINFRHPM